LIAKKKCITVGHDAENGDPKPFAGTIGMEDGHIHHRPRPQRIDRDCPSTYGPVSYEPETGDTQELLRISATMTKEINSVPINHG
jgi:hypothetical protein